MKKVYVSVLWVLLVILAGIAFCIMVSCAPVKMVPPVSCLNSEWFKSDMRRQRQGILRNHT